MVSMKDIAKQCGVSIATVSKALNNYSDVGEKTREKVRKAAEEAGYFPNSSARALKTNRTYNIGVLFMVECRSGLTHDYFVAVLNAFKVRAESKGYDITFTTCHQGGRRMSYYEHCRYRGVDGVAVICADFYNPEVQGLIHSSLPVVTVDHLFDSRSAVYSDNVAGMKELVNYVCSMGHTKIAYIYGSNTSVTKNRLTSFYRTLAEHGIEPPDVYMRESKYRDTERAKALTLELLDLPDPPTCILYPDDIAALGGMNAIKDRGLRVPDDISIVGYDGVMYTRLIEPQLTTICQDTTEIGRIAADRLIQEIENPRLALIEHVVVKGWLQKGRSVKDLRK